MLSPIELGEIAKKADVSQQNLNKLKPYFDILRENIHKKWEELSLEDGANAKLLKFQLKAVLELERAMIKEINEGKQALKKLETKQ